MSKYVIFLGKGARRQSSMASRVMLTAVGSAETASQSAVNV